MKIYLDDQLVFELSETKQKILKNDIAEEDFIDDIKRRLEWVIDHKCNKCIQRLKDEWIPKLKESGVKSIPLDDCEFAQVVFNRSEYRDRSSRNADDQRKKLR